MKPTYPELLKGFKAAVKPNPTEEEEEYIHKIIDKLRSSEDWKKEDE